MKSSSSIAIVGAGNVAFHLAKAIVDAGYRVDTVYNRSLDKAQELAQYIGSRATNDLADLQGCKLILCAVSDDALPELIPLLSTIAPVAATSGTTNVLALPHTAPVGVFYPLQTFSRLKAVDLAVVPFFIESDHPILTQRLHSLARSLSPIVTELSWEKRVPLHLSAVFVNNFTNHLIDIAQQHLAADNLPFEWLKPLLKETVAKLDFQSAKDAQTGPARRNDQQTIQQHLSMLPKHEAALYKLLSESIRQRYSS